jgi:hypothetical protein
LYGTHVDLTRCRRSRRRWSLPGWSPTSAERP